MTSTINIKRAYEPPSKKDGVRILVDRLWPRGVTREDANIDEWARDLAPTSALRKWFGHDPELWPEFKKRYEAELKKNEKVNEFTEKYRGKKAITLVYGAKDELHNHAIVLKSFLEGSFTN